MKEIELDDANKLLNENWIKENMSLDCKSPTYIKLTSVVKWHYFDEQNFEIKELHFNEVFGWYHKNNYIFRLNGKFQGLCDEIYAPTITELKTKLLINIKNRLEEIDIEKKELLNKVEDICDL